MSDLMKRVAVERDEGAFAELFRIFGPKVKAMLMRSGADAAMAEDIAQETLLSVWRKAHLFSEVKGSAVTWMFTIARNLRIDRLRREVPWQELSERELETPESSPDPEQSVGDEEEFARVRSSLSTLPEEQREILVLAFQQGLSHSEIAGRLNLPLGTVKSRMRLGYQRIREALEVRS
ncbi:MAG: sigma-70 family RNA polymerase sigma factor [Hyphomicrobiaceae bacterium]|nr:MAG: sigma-70 family RNA polymerase sigma factor [Hyphomicrobiaceae bacterium]